MGEAGRHGLNTESIFGEDFFGYARYWDETVHKPNSTTLIDQIYSQGAKTVLGFDAGSLDKANRFYLDSNSTKNTLAYVRKIAAGDIASINLENLFTSVQPPFETVWFQTEGEASVIGNLLTHVRENKYLMNIVFSDKEKRKAKSIVRLLISTNCEGYNIRILRNAKNLRLNAEFLGHFFTKFLWTVFYLMEQKTYVTRERRERDTPICSSVSRIDIISDIILTIPREILIYSGAKSEKNGTSNRMQYHVRGAWHMRRKMARQCEHEFEDENDRRQRCKHCHALRWLQKAHTRGNPELGMMVKDRYLRVARPREGAMANHLPPKPNLNEFRDASP